MREMKSIGNYNQSLESLLIAHRNESLKAE